MTRLSRPVGIIITATFLATAIGLTYVGAAPPATSTQGTLQVFPPEAAGQMKIGTLNVPANAAAATQPASIHGTMVLMGVQDDPKSVRADHAILIPDAPALPYAVKFQVGATKLPKGDTIVITEVRGTADQMTPGNIYLIKGAYTLASHDRAMIAAFTTAKDSADTKGPTLKVQTTTVNKGDGSFTLYLPMSVNGWPHISFYPADGGADFGGTYFGTGDCVLKEWWGSAGTGTGTGSSSGH